MSLVTAAVTRINGNWTVHEDGAPGQTVTVRRGDELTWRWPSNGSITVCMSPFGPGCTVVNRGSAPPRILVPNVSDGYYCYVLLLTLNGTTVAVSGASGQGGCSDELVPADAEAWLRKHGDHPLHPETGVRPRIRVRGSAVAADEGGKR